MYLFGDFRFPKDPVIKEKWILATGRQSLQLSLTTTNVIPMKTECYKHLDYIRYILSINT